MSRNRGLPTNKQRKALDERDPALGAAMKRLPPYPGFTTSRSADNHFHSLARTIIYQQLAGNAAATIHGRVHALTPGPRFPTAEDIMNIPDGRLKKAGLSGAKQASIRDLATRVINRDLRLQSISRFDDQAIIERLTTVRGIGPWSLDGLRNRPSQAQLEARGACWAPLRSVATWTLYRLVDEAREA
jgi:DNA-3-methyladenine glycosylase II